MRAQEEQALVERLDWRIASRDDAAVAQALASGAEVEEVYALEAGALLDGFWASLGEVGVQDLLAGVTVAARARVIVPTIQVLLTYHLKILMGIASINALPALLFSDQAAMRQLGFNAALLTAGLTRRSADRRGPAQAPPRPMCPEVIGDLVGALSAAEASAYFNGVIARLAAWGASASSLPWCARTAYACGRMPGRWSGRGRAIAASAPSRCGTAVAVPPGPRSGSLRWWGSQG